MIGKTDAQTISIETTGAFTVDDSAGLLETNKSYFQIELKTGFWKNLPDSCVFEYATYAGQTNSVSVDFGGCF
ncbi:hypothetical protein D3C83_153390 [compost metagenome]